MIINFDMLKTFYSAIVNRMKGFRGNWNQNDSTADDYIKGRTHYEERKNVTVEHIPTEENLGQTYLGRFPIVAIGDTVNITVDGVEYSLVAYDNWGDLIIGGTWDDVYEGTGEYDWLICFEGGEYGYFCSHVPHTVSWEVTEVTLLDHKFLTEGYPYKDECEGVLFDGFLTIEHWQPKEPFNLKFTENKTYEVVYDGVKYVLTAWDDGYGDVCIGSKNIYDGNYPVENEPPFCFCEGWIGTADESGKHSVTIVGFGEVAHPISDALLPSEFAAFARDYKYTKLVEWDGNDSGKDSFFTASNRKFVKVSDELLAEPGKWRFITQSDSPDKMQGECSELLDEDGKCWRDGLCLYVSEPGTYYDWSGYYFTAPSAGTYVQKLDPIDDPVYVTGIYEQLPVKCITGIVINAGVANQKQYRLFVDDYGNLKTRLLPYEQEIES